MKQLLCLLTLAAALGAQTQPYVPYGIGGVAGVVATTGSGIYPTNSATTWVSFGFQLPAGKTLVKVRMMVNSIIGTVASTDMSCEVQAETNLIPSGTALATSNTVTAPHATGAWSEFTGYSLALSAYTPYRLVFKNGNGTPGSNYVNIRTFAGFGAGMMSGPASAVQSTTNGTTWAQGASNATPIYRLEFADGTFQGNIVELATPVASGIATNHRIRASVSSGVTFTTPAGLSWSVSGCAAPIGKLSTPTGTLKCYIDSDDGATITNIVSSANSYAAAGVDTTARNSPFFFASPTVLSPSTKYRVYLTESAQTDTSLIYYGINMWTTSNDANSLSLLPMQGTWRGTYCTSSCTSRASWTDDTVNIPGIVLLLTPAGEATSSGGSSGTRSYSH